MHLSNYSALVIYMVGKDFDSHMHHDYSEAFKNKNQIHKLIINNYIYWKSLTFILLADAFKEHIFICVIKKMVLALACWDSSISHWSNK